MQRFILFVALFVVLASQPGLAASTTTTTTNSTVVNPNQLGIPAPYQLRRTQDKNACFSHGGGVYCQDDSQMRQPVLIWEWNGNTNSIDGFHLYKAVGRVLQADIPAQTGKRITWAAWTAPSGACYVMTAYKGTQESGDSNKWCMPLTIDINRSVAPIH